MNLINLGRPKGRPLHVVSVALGALLIPAAAFAQGQRAVQQGPAPEVPRTLRAAAPIDLTGTWVSVVSEDWRWRMITPPRYDYPAVPLNAEGRQAADKWDPNADEAAGLQCKVYGAASVMRLPGRLKISWGDDNTLKVETDAGTQTRLLRFAAPAPGGERTWQGHSRAIWQIPEATGRGGRGGGPVASRPDEPALAGRSAFADRPAGQLKVVTTHMSPGYLRTNGVPYSENAVLTEYFVRVTAPNKDEWLVVTSIVDDPVYLNEPFVTSTHFKKEPNDAKFAPTPCVVHR